MSIHAPDAQTPDIQQLIRQLSHPDRAQRLEALRRIRAEADAGHLARPDVGRDVNSHIHTTYSFSPYSPSLAAFLAWQAGLATAGIMDHDSISGAREFSEAGQILGLATTIGCELRASFAGTILEEKRINNPDQDTIAYLALHGVPHTEIDALDAFLAPLRAARGQRNRQMADRLSALLSPHGLALDYDRDVLPLSMAHEGGGVTERHLLFAVAKMLVARFGAGPTLTTFLTASLEIPLAEKPRAYLEDTANPQLAYDLLNVLKGELVDRFYVPATAECPTVAEVVAFAKAHGIILAYPYLGDVTASVTGDKKAQHFEDAYLVDLFGLLDNLGFRAITYMPSRNTRPQLEYLQALCERYGFFQISGEDINQPRQAFICLAMREPRFAGLHDAAWALIGHERLATHYLQDGFLSPETVSRFPGLPERIAHFRDAALAAYALSHSQ